MGKTDRGIEVAASHAAVLNSESFSSRFILVSLCLGGEEAPIDNRKCQGPPAPYQIRQPPPAGAHEALPERAPALAAAKVENF